MSAPVLEAPIHKNRVTTMGRIAGFTSKTSLFSNVNLASKLYSDERPLTSIDWWALPGGSGAWKNYTFRQIVAQTYTPVTIGDVFGPLWSTHWFRIVITIPAAWIGKEVRLRWVTKSEATIWRDDGADGQVLQGISPDFREEYVLNRSWPGGGPITLYVEMACNNMFGSGDDVYDSEITPPDPEKTYTLLVADIATFEPTMFKLYTDLEILYQIAENLGDDHKGYQAMFAANQMVTLIEDEQYSEASEIANRYFAQGNGQKAYTLISMGNCHIDTAWLWPYDETIRKCVRSWSAQIRLMEEYPDLIFTCSQAQQYAWMKEFYPTFYEEMKSAITSGQFVPVGGTWVEMDGNIPNGESFMRQFFYGQRFFRQEFGITCREFWLPDTFGYSAQIPQMIKHVGITRFMTQKMSWNLVNKFPNHNFWWEGIDGTQVLVHFPPGSTYNMKGDVEGVRFSQTNSEDKGRANVAIYLFGVGDGGGGPTRTFIERQKRLQNVDGIPKIRFGTPEEFWIELEKESSKFYKWVGELYLELHNATYTTQSKIKWYNRKCEFFFREVELEVAIALVHGKITQAELFADIETIDENWKQVLLNQFHDVLPGSCIQMVAEDAWRLYEGVFTALTELRSKYNTLILGPIGTNNIVYNPLNWNIETVIFNQGAGLTGANTQSVTIRAEPIEESTEGHYRIPNTFTAALVDMSASGYSVLTPKEPTNPVSYTSNATTATLSNGLINLQVSLNGFPTETMTFTGHLSGRSGIVVYNDRLGTGIEPATLYLYRDVPLFWDAWDVNDYHLETRRALNYSSTPVVEPFSTNAPLVGGYKWTSTFGNGSTVERYAILRANSRMIEYFLIVDWKESHKFLKVEFPVDVLSREATYEIQYGHAQRPTHINTSWDMAKFEVCGHKWMDISQRDKGVTFITDSKYGWHVRDNIVKLSLVRAPKNPDANCDMHKHYIYYAVLPHEGTFQGAEVIRRAYELNYFGSNNVLVSKAASTTVPQNLISCDSPAIVVEACKPAHDRSDAILVRSYEAFGGSQTTRFTAGFPLNNVIACNGLEDPETDIPFDSATNSFDTIFSPFQIRSFLLVFA